MCKRCVHTAKTPIFNTETLTYNWKKDSDVMQSRSNDRSRMNDIT